MRIAYRQRNPVIAPKSYRRIEVGTTKIAFRATSTNRLQTMRLIKHILPGLVFAGITLLTTSTASANLVSDSRRALQQLVAQNPAAARAKSKAIAVLVFPDVVKAGFILGAQEGQGILFLHGRPSGRYRTGSRLLWLASWRSKIRLRTLLDEPKGSGLGK